jgi:hypothetical protein
MVEISHFRHITGVDVTDGDPNEVRLSCFDPVRREIARFLWKLIRDGRISLQELKRS